MGKNVSNAETQRNGRALPRGELFELLSDDRRRYTIEYLRDATKPVALADLSREIAEWESEHSPESADNHAELILHSMYHCHVPKLVDRDVLAHDQDRNTVRPGANFEDVADLLDALPAADGADPDR